MTRASRGHLVLPFGAFYGAVDRRHAAPGLEFSVLGVDPHRVVERHSHDEAHFVYVLDGLYVSSAEGAPPVSEGPALIFNPAGTTHRDRFEARDRQMTGRFVTVSVEGGYGHPASGCGALPATSRALTHAAGLTLGRHLAAACLSVDVDAGLRREALTFDLLNSLSATHDSLPASAPAWLRHARHRLDDTLGHAPSLSEIARDCGVHPVHLARVFRRYVGTSPADYHRQRRLSLARSLVTRTRRSLSDIAVACGFVDQAHFTHAFRKAFGVTPSVYRREVRS